MTAPTTTRSAYCATDHQAHEDCQPAPFDVMTFWGQPYRQCRHYRAHEYATNLRFDLIRARERQRWEEYIAHEAGYPGAVVVIP